MSDNKEFSGTESCSTGTYFHHRPNALRTGHIRLDRREGGVVWVFAKDVLRIEPDFSDGSMLIESFIAAKETCWLVLMPDQKRWWVRGSPDEVAKRLGWRECERPIEL